MPERVLTRRELNRATLARQMLLDRAAMTVPDAVRRLVGMQAQTTNAPYIGLWTRLPAFRRDDLTDLLRGRQIVRATFLRSTLHLAAADDYLRLWPTLQPALARALNAFFGQRAKGLDIPCLVAAARAGLEEQPRPFTELRALLSEIAPERDPDALAYAVRTHLPLVQVAPGGTWGAGGSVAYALAEPWLGGSLGDADLRPLLHRYLAAFGPATVQDFGAWSGLTRVREAVAPLVAGLRTFRDEGGRVLLDLPDLPLPPADAPAPVRFLPEYDNLILSHADRTRVVPDAHRAKIFLSAGRVRATFLVDGFVAGTWKIAREKDAARLVIEPFAPLPDDACDALGAEGERLVRFIEGGAESFAVQFAEVP